MSQAIPSPRRGALVYAAWLVSVVATLGSLYFSEVMRLPPCTLCWYQRIAMYPLPVVLAAGILLRDTRVRLYALPLALAGLAVSAYHNLLYYYYGALREGLTTCTAGVSCTTRQIEWLGFITIPLLALAAFTLVTYALILAPSGRPAPVEAATVPPAPGRHELRRLVVLGAAALALVAGTGAAARLASPAAQSAPPDPARLVRADSPTLGPADAPVTLVEFLDPECESCRAAHPGVKRLLAEYPTSVRLVVRYCPLHHNSIVAAATEAAGEQGRYWVMQDLLFATQPDWDEQRTLHFELFTRYAAAMGLDAERFAATMENEKWIAKAERDRDDGVALGVRGTPTFFLNGTLVRDFSYAGLKAAVDAALRGR